MELICIYVPQLRLCLWLISCCSGGQQTVYRYQPNQAENCKGNSAMEIRAASASAKFRQSNRTDKWIELAMQLFHCCLTARVGTWSTIHFMTQYTQGCSAKKRGVGTPFPRVPTPLHHWFRLKPNSNTKYRSDALTRQSLLWFSQSIQTNYCSLPVTYSATALKLQN